MRLIFALLLAARILSPQMIIIAKKKASASNPVYQQMSSGTNWGASGSTTTGAWDGGGLTSGRMVVGYAAGGPGTENLTISDSCGNSINYIDAALAYVSFWFNVTTGGSCQLAITWTGGGNGTGWIIAHEWSGVTTLGEHTANSQSYGAYGASDSITTGSVTTSAKSGCSAFTRTGDVNGTNITAGTGWTASGSVTNFYQLVGEYRAQSSAGSIAGTFQDANNVSGITVRSVIVCVY